MVLPLQLAEAAGPVATVERLGGHRGHDSDTGSDPGLTVPAATAPENGWGPALALAAVRAGAVVILVMALAFAACASEPAPVTEADYVVALQAICADTTDTIDALPQPPDEITVPAFATSAASALDDEAERARSLEVPDSAADDHRAFIRNTEEQSTAWRAIATADDETLDSLTVRVGELIRGRNDLAEEMGVPACRRGGV